jgi:hypothetical protein
MLKWIAHWALFHVVAAVASYIALSLFSYMFDMSQFLVGAVANPGRHLLIFTSYCVMSGYSVLIAIQTCQRLRGRTVVLLLFGSIMFPISMVTFALLHGSIPLEDRPGLLATGISSSLVATFIYIYLERQFRGNSGDTGHFRGHSSE